MLKTLMNIWSKFWWKDYQLLRTGWLWSGADVRKLYRSWRILRLIHSYLHKSASIQPRTRPPKSYYSIFSSTRCWSRKLKYNSMGAKTSCPKESTWGCRMFNISAKAKCPKEGRTERTCLLACLLGTWGRKIHENVWGWRGLQFGSTRVSATALADKLG